MTQQAQNENETIIRFSSTWWIYMVARGGILRGIVNGIEDTIAITGRTLLLVFLLYCGVKSGALLVKPDWSPPIWLEMSMFVLQLAGLEGSIPGLARYADTLHHKDDKAGARKVEGVMKSARIMTILTIGEGVLHLFGMDNQILRIISGVLLLVRGIVITSFLMELAKIDAKGPRVLSRDEHRREEQNREIEGEQDRVIADLHTELDQVRVTLTTAQQKAQQNEDEQISLIQRLRDQITLMETLQNATLASADGQTRILTDLQSQLSDAGNQVRNLTALLDQKRRDFERVDADLQTANLQIVDLQIAESKTAKMREDNQDLSANLQTANLHIADLAAKLERAKVKIAYLQNGDSNVAPSAKPRPAKADSQQVDPSKITSIDEVRAKHDAGSGQSRTKVSHADVIAFMASHPTLKRAEVAEQLSISERKVYDAVAWQRDQEKEQGNAASAN